MASSAPRPPPRSAVTAAPTDAALLETLLAEGHVAPTLKAVFEGGHEQSFQATLSGLITQKDQEITDLCNFHYKVFSSI